MTPIEIALSIAVVYLLVAHIRLAQRLNLVSRLLEELHSRNHAQAAVTDQRFAAIDKIYEARFKVIAESQRLLGEILGCAKK